ncbi:glycosyltransferase [Legionella impletisoli]|uniref:Glycosyl transferase n=1 Tax=Legionella impletisoli TaxID=343510 RepID=A0A917JUM9_9GAMM|nr:glycosyltransferase [Legionella impletisoli]GGI82333.1 glycosyl transferase [Legionella impletisoli]
MRILTVLDSYPPDLNGGAYFTHRLAKGLQSRGHDVLVICPSRNLSQGYRQYEGIPLYTVRSWPVMLYKNFRICWPLFIKKGLVKAIDDFKPDVVHLQGKFILGGMTHRVSQQKGLPQIATNHFMPENFFHYTKLPKSLEYWFNRVTWKNVIDMLSKVDVVTTPTKTAAELLACVGLQKKVIPVSCGVDLKQFKPNQNASTLREQFNIPHKPILLYTGRLDKEKNLPEVLKAFQLAKATVDAHLVLTGRGAEFTALRSLVKALRLENDVTFTGYLSDEDYPHIYGLANCFINASTAELQSIVSLEALASGLPLIGANAVALPELIEHGVNGYLFEPGDVKTLAQYIVALLRDKDRAKKMGSHSYEIARQHDLNKTIEQYETLYKDIAIK